MPHLEGNFHVENIGGCDMDNCVHKQLFRKLELSFRRQEAELVHKGGVINGLHAEINALLKYIEKLHKENDKLRKKK